MKKYLLPFLLNTIMLLGSLSFAHAQTVTDAVQSGDTVQLAQLIAAGGNINMADANGTTPLMLACNLGDEVSARILAGAGANLDAKDSKGRTAVLLAASYGYIDILNLLLASGADVTLRDNRNMRPFDHAVEADSEKAAKQTPRNTRIDVDAVYQILYSKR